MKPLFLIITGINHECNEFEFYKSILQDQYDIVCIQLTASNLVSPSAFSALLDDAGKFNLGGRNVFIMAHSFGCIVALYLVKQYNIETATELLFIDPTTQYMRRHAERIGMYLGELLDAAPKDVVSRTIVFTYWPQGCTPKSCLSKHIDQHDARVGAIKNLWSDPAHPTIVSLYLPSSKLAYIPHNLHRLLPNNIGKHIALPTMTAGRYTRRVHKKQKTHLHRKRYTIRVG
jgi:hypothetical protein